MPAGRSSDQKSRVITPDDPPSPRRLVPSTHHQVQIAQISSSTAQFLHGMSLEARVQSAELAMASLASQVAALESSGPVSGKSAGFEDFKSSVRTRCCPLPHRIASVQRPFMNNTCSVAFFSIRVAAPA
jgi:hypothetical protein